MIGAAGLRIIPQRDTSGNVDPGSTGRSTLQRVEIPAACHGIAGLRNADAFIEVGAGKRGKSEIAYHPAVSQMIIQNKWVSAVLSSRKACPPMARRMN